MQFDARIQKNEEKKGKMRKTSEIKSLFHKNKESFQAIMCQRKKR